MRIVSVNRQNLKQPCRVVEMANWRAGRKCYVVTTRVEKDIILSKIKTMLCGINNILHNIFHIRLNMENILQNIVSPIEHCYEL